ncbi:MAG: hypothetical protein M3220_13105 [Chloroflexota bacterium]|nr:hypothetical protein [Chloroflexota bacterium]
MKGMIDGRRLKHAWDNRELGRMLLGVSPYEYEADADTQAYFTRMRQVSDFLHCRTPRERRPRLAELYDTLESSDQGWAKAAAIFLRQSFGEETRD